MRNTKRLLPLLLLLLSVLFVGCSQPTEDLPNTEPPLTLETLPPSSSAESMDEDVFDESVQATSVTEAETETEEATAPASEEADATSEREQEASTESEASPEVPLQPSVEEAVGVVDIRLSVYNVSLRVGQKKMPIVTMLPQHAADKGERWISSDPNVATVDSIGNIRGVAEGTCTVSVASTDNPAVFATVSVTVLPEAELTYIDGILVVNKTYPLPSAYAPGWETEASAPFWEMVAAAKEAGFELWMSSGYRSYADQEYLYNGYVQRDGQEAADTYSARPGHSEHQTGLAFDLNGLSWDFGDTPEGIWVAENCHKYGFILRYPKGKEEITGYTYEPWHIRYLGVEKATEVYESGLCLEEFLNITSVYAY